MTSFACARVAKNSQSISSGSYQTISLDTVLLDDPGYWQAGQPTRMTVPSGLDGVYLTMGHQSSLDIASGRRGVQLLKNGAVTATHEYVGSDLYTITAAPVWDVQQLSAGDYMELQLLQASGSAKNFFSEIKLARIASSSVCYATFSGSLGLSADVWTTIDMTTESIDTDGMHSTTTNPSRVTIQTDGNYLILTNIVWSPQASYKVTRIRKNGAALNTSGFPYFWEIGSATPNINSVNGFAILTLTAGDYIEVDAISKQAATVTSGRIAVIGVGASQCGYATGNDAAAISAATYTDVPLQEELCDPYGWHSNIVNPERFNVQKAATYLFFQHTTENTPEKVSGQDLKIAGVAQGSYGQLVGNSSLPVSAVAFNMRNAALNDIVILQGYSGDAADTIRRYDSGLAWLEMDTFTAISSLSQIYRRN